MYPLQRTVVEARMLLEFCSATYGGQRLGCQCLFQAFRTQTEFNSVLDENVVGIAVQPLLTGLSGGDHRMSAGVRMFARVPVRRAVAAQCDAACLARPQMYPIAADLYAFFTFEPLRLLN
jgi:hypothetical protein